MDASLQTVLLICFREKNKKNANWSLLKTIRTTNVHPDQGVFFIYNIMCQYWVYLKSRIGILLPDELEFDQAVSSMSMLTKQIAFTDLPLRLF